MAIGNGSCTPSFQARRYSDARGRAVLRPGHQYEHIVDVQETFGKVFNAGTAFQRDRSQFDRLLADGDSYMLGTMRGHVLHTAGHTPACTTHVIGNAAFVGDTLFMPDGGSARADFPAATRQRFFIDQAPSYPPYRHAALHLPRLWSQRP